MRSYSSLVRKSRSELLKDLSDRETFRDYSQLPPYPTIILNGLKSCSNNSGRLEDIDRSVRAAYPGDITDWHSLPRLEETMEALVENDIVTQTSGNIYTLKQKR